KKHARHRIERAALGRTLADGGADDLAVEPREQEACVRVSGEIVRELVDGDADSLDPLEDGRDRRQVFRGGGGFDLHKTLASGRISRRRRDLTSRFRGRRCAPDQKNSPSRWRFRSPNRPTFRLPVQPPDSVSTYLRSVLGASANLKHCAPPFKRG